LIGYHPTGKFWGHRYQFLANYGLGEICRMQHKDYAGEQKMGSAALFPEWAAANWKKIKKA